MQEILSPNKYDGRIAPVMYIVEHTMEVPESDRGVAESVCRQFQSAARKASCHVATDADSSVRSVPDEDTAWAAPGANATGLQHELAGYAGQSASDWQDATSQMILANAAQVDAAWAAKYGIPLRHLSVDELRAGNVKGFIGHVDATYAFHKSDHTDPGTSFPWDQYLAMVAAAMGTAPAVSIPVSNPVLVNLTVSAGSTGSAVVRLQQFLGISADGIFGPQTVAAVKAYQAGLGLVPDGVVGPLTWAKITSGARPSAPAPRFADIRALQRALRTAADNVWGPDTQKRWDALLAASTYGGGLFPYGVAYTQGVVGTTQDGSWGSKSRAAHDTTVRAVQAAVGAAQDGVVGPETVGKVNAAHAASQHTV